MNETLLAQAQAAKAASRKLAGLSTQIKNRALEGIAEALIARQEEILAENAVDVERARDNGLADAPLNRLRLTPEKIAAIAGDVRTVARLPDPVGELIDGSRLPNGLEISRRRVPLGVLAAVFESRPTSPSTSRRSVSSPATPVSCAAAARRSGRIRPWRASSGRRRRRPASRRVRCS